MSDLKDKARGRAILQVNGAGNERDGVYAFDSLLERYPADRLASGRRIGADEVAAYFHTGGTTGTPKLVRHTHANQVYQAWVCNLMLKMRPGRTMLFGLPLYHVHGLVLGLLGSLRIGNRFVHTGKPSPSAYAAAGGSMTCRTSC